MGLPKTIALFTITIVALSLIRFGDLHIQKDSVSSTSTVLGVHISPQQNHSSWQNEEIQHKIPQPNGHITIAITASATATPSSFPKKRKLIHLSPTITPFSSPIGTPPSKISPTITFNDQLLTSLNAYRKNNNVPPLYIDTKLNQYAQLRASLFLSNGALDNHAGFITFINNQNGFSKLGYHILGENSSEGYQVSAQNLIEQIYGKSPEHNRNELNSNFTNVGIGVEGSYTDFVFGGQKQ